jgi:hypothetical protein
MFASFKYERISLSDINLDYKNPRIVTQLPLGTQDEIVKYLFEYEGLGTFLKKIASEGKNLGAEQPYVIEMGKSYTVIEGNTRIATYKLLTGILAAPIDYASLVPHIPEPAKKELLQVDCAVAPSRDALLPIMAAAHFGRGDKSKWGYLGSRKAVYDEWTGGKETAQLAATFDKTQSEIREYLVEYRLYQAALDYKWTAEELKHLLNPAVAFNPPVRFLQSLGHKTQMGMDLDKVNLEVKFNAPDSKDKYRHLIKRLVIDEKGLGATASYESVFQDYIPPADQKANDPPKGNEKDDTTSGAGSEHQDNNADTSTADKSDGGGGHNGGGEAAKPLKNGALFNYPVKSSNLLFQQLMKEASSLNTKTFPAAGTALLRGLIETLLKDIIHDQNANKQNKFLSLETALDICLGNEIAMAVDDRKLLKMFKKDHLDYINLGTHGTTLCNYLRLMQARDCIDQFVKRNV